METMNSDGLREAGRDLFADIDIAPAANNG